MDIVCFANDWYGDPLSKKHVMRRLARRGAACCGSTRSATAPPRSATRRTACAPSRKLDPLRPLGVGRPARGRAEHLGRRSPIAVPVYGIAAGRARQRALRRRHVRNAAWRLGLRDPLLYTFVPASAWVAGQLGERASSTTASTSTPPSTAPTPGHRSRSRTSSSGAPTCSSPARRRSSRARSAARRDARSSSATASSTTHFARALDPATAIPEALRALPQPVVGFFGLIAEWVDLEPHRRGRRRLAREGAARWSSSASPRRRPRRLARAAARCRTSSSSGAGRTPSCPATAAASTSRSCRSS